MTKTILFDLDGTLTDSGEGIINCTLPVLEHFGLPIPAREDMRFMVGPPLEYSFRRFGVPADRVWEAIEIYRKRYVTIGKYENFPYPGIEALLQKLRADGHRLLVATSKPETMAVDILTKFGLAPYFDRICGASLDASRGTKSQVIAYLLQETGGVDKPVMVGDTFYDVQGAAEHGIATIGVAWGYGEVADMVNAGAAAIADTPEHLYRLLSE